MLLTLATSSRKFEGRLGHTSMEFYHEGGAPEIAWKIHTKMAAEATKVFIACDIKNGFGAVLGQIFTNLWQEQPTAWANTSKGSRPIAVRNGFLQGVCEAPVAFALALRVALTEFEDEMRKQGWQGSEIRDRTGILGIR